MSVNLFHTLLAVSGVLGVLGFVSWTPAPVAYAATIVVNTTADQATGGDGKCTLREAIQNANADAETSNGDCPAGNGDDTITFRMSGTITLSSVLPTIATGMTIDATQGNVTLDAAQQSPILVLDGFPFTASVTGLTFVNAVCNLDTGGGAAITNFAGVELTVNDSTFQGNDASDCLGGGGIHNSGGTLTVNNGRFDGNTAGSEGGAAIFNSGNASISDSGFAGNTGSAVYSNTSSATMTVVRGIFVKNGGANYGGAIFNDGATLNVTASTFNGNTTNDEGYGGGIASRNGTANITTSYFVDNFAKRGGGVYNDTGTLNVTASTFNNNEGWGAGGGLYNVAGPMVLTNSTVTENTTSGRFGGAIYTENGSLHVVNSTLVSNSCVCGAFGTAGIYGDGTAITIRNTILANDDGNCDTDPLNMAFDNYATDNSCSPAATQVSQDALNLGNLTWNGGPNTIAPTIRPGPGSVAINGGDNGVCAAAVGAPTYGAGGVDQRGVTRPQGAVCDAGAYEVRATLGRPPRPRPATQDNGRGR